MSDEFIEKFTHTLKKKFDVAHSGQLMQAETITVFAPTNAINMLTSVIETQYGKAMFDAMLKLSDITKDQRDQMESSQDKKESDSDGSSYMLLASHGNMEMVLTAFKKIMTTKNVAFVNDIEQVTTDIFDKISNADNRELLVGYIENFLTTSLST